MVAEERKAYMEGGLCSAHLVFWPYGFLRPRRRARRTASDCSDDGLTTPASYQDQAAGYAEAEADAKGRTAVGHRGPCRAL